MISMRNQLLFFFVLRVLYRSVFYNHNPVEQYSNNNRIKNFKSKNTMKLILWNLDKVSVKHNSYQKAEGLSEQLHDKTKHKLVNSI